MKSGLIGPLAFCRLDESLTGRIARSERLGSLLLEAFTWLVIGAAVYGAVLGGWRSGLQGLYAAVKLPLLLIAIVASSASANAAFAKLTNTRLTVGQVVCCSLVSMSILAIILASVSPVSALIASSTERFGETLRGWPGPESSVARRKSQWLLAMHVLVIGTAGSIAIWRMRGLLFRLVGSRLEAARLFWLCLAVQILVGTQLSWILRPYLGKPWIPVEFFRPDAFRGSFFEEIGRWWTSAS